MNLILVNNSKMRMPRQFVEAWCQSLGQKLKLAKTCELTIVFLDTKPARALNLEFRKKDYATDILSFSAADTELKKNLGELVLCPQVLKRQALEHGLSQKAELGYMLIHGVLHLLGFEHEGRGPQARRESQEMYQLQDQLFDSLTTKFHLESYVHRRRNL